MAGLDCKMWCMMVSASGFIFLLFLGILVAFDAQSLYVHRQNPLASAVALIFSAIIYGALFAYLYYQKYVNITRRQHLANWLQSRRTTVHQMVPIVRKDLHQKE